jgi:glycosyltransferase involved in cell wall biosynthesis
MRHAGEYDVVHIHALFSWPSLVAALSAQLRRVPYVVRPLGVLNRWGIRNRRPWLKRMSFALIEKRILQGAALLQFTSEQEYEAALELQGAHRATVIPNPVPIAKQLRRGNFRERHPQLRLRRIVLFLSRIDRIKGLDLLLAAFAKARMSEPDLALVIAGNGDRKWIRALQNTAEMLSIAPNVIWAGFVGGQAKWDLIADADIFVLPSYSENFGVAAVEAMGAGIPVIITDQVGIHREAGRAGAALVTACDESQIAQAISQISQDCQLRERLGKEGQTFARQFTEKATAERLIRVYEEVLRRTVRATLQP